MFIRIGMLSRHCYGNSQAQRMNNDDEPQPDLASQAPSKSTNPLLSNLDSRTAGVEVSNGPMA